MKKLIPLMLLVLVAATANAQITFTLTTAPCHNDGVLTANFTGLTAPLTVEWTTYGTTGTTITHTGVTGSSDALTSYSGGPVNIRVTDAASGISYSGYAGAAPFTYSVTTTPAYCPALGTANVTVTGGTAPYTYNWFSIPAMTTVGTTNPVSLPGGGYGITITDAAGCTYGSEVDFDSVNVSSIASFTFPVTNTPANCTNGTATVGTITGGTGPFSYSWSNGATTSSITGLTMGSYMVTVTDASGCSGSGWTYVSQVVSISVPITPTPATCVMNNGAVIAFPSGGVPPYTYVWSNSVTTQSQSGLAAGSYNVTATDANGCIGHGYTNVMASTPITVTYGTTPSSCTSNTGTATLTPAGGTAPYSVIWYTTPIQTTMTATSLAPGTHSFKVTDAAGCVRTGSAVVPPVSVINTVFSATPALCTLATGSISVTATGGVTPYTYSWSGGGTTSSVTGRAAGWHTVTITDALGCQVVRTKEIPYSSPVSLAVASVPASCIFTNDGIAVATASGGTTPYTYSWSSGATTSTASSLLTGRYWAYVTDAAGCTATNYVLVPYNTSATSCYCTIEGTVYHDVNNNCIQDPGEGEIHNIQMACSGGIGYTYTDASGHYSFKVPTGSYTISETIRAFYPLSTCQTNHIPISVTASSGCTHTINFANTINPIHDIHVSTWDFNHAVPGNLYYQKMLITNEGTVPESTILAGYKPDGQLFAPTFAPGSIFSGSPYYYSASGTFPTLAPGASQAFLNTYTVPTSIPMGTSVLFKDTAVYNGPMTNWLTDYSPANNPNYFNTTIVSSYDPNFKEVSPKGTGPAGTITAADTILEYMVHFQNLGTWQAQNVVVIDTLDNNLDWTTMRPVYQSAQCQVSLRQVGAYKIATFTFNNINLPAAMYEPIASNGMFTYTIKRLPGLAIGSTIRNSASIYFDYNAPVKTNTTLNTIGAVTGVANFEPDEYHSFTVYPNPTSKSFNALIVGSEDAEGTMYVSDITGKVMISKALNLHKGEQTISTDVSQLAPGMYLVSLNKNGKTETSKLVIMQ